MANMIVEVGETSLEGTPPLRKEIPVGLNKSGLIEATNGFDIYVFDLAAQQLYWKRRGDKKLKKMPQKRVRYIGLAP